MSNELERELPEQPSDAPHDKDPWQKPEILSFQPAASTQGIFYNPLDGISNLTP